MTFEERYEEILEYIKSQKDVPIILEGTDEFKERLKLQKYDDPINFIKPHKKEN